MKITVDGRTGSNTLVKPLSELLAGSNQVVSGQLKFGDIAWTSTDREGEPLPVAVEFKKIPDLLDSIFGDNPRFIDHQLPGLVGRYRVVYLLIEGRWRANKDTGALEIKSGKVGRKGWESKSLWHTSGYLYESVMGALSTIECHPGVLVGHTGDRVETLWWLRSHIKWWSKGLGHHKTCRPRSGTDILGGRYDMRSPSEVERVAAVLPGIGAERAEAAAKRFKTMDALINSTPEQWVGLRSSERLTEAGRKYPGLNEEQAKRVVAAFTKLHK